MIADIICSQLQLNKNQLDEYESMILLDTLLFLYEEDIKIELD